MRPEHLKTKIFLDSGLPDETRSIMDRLGFLDGQTTNPSLITKHPSFIACAAKGEKCTEADAWQYYREIVQQIAPLIPDGSISIEVYADQSTTANMMIAKGRELASWIPNTHVKLPITAAGLTAAETLTAEGIRVNLTLCFSQEQAAAVYAATREAKPGDVFVSPFVGRLDDQGTDGMSLVANIQRMYAAGNGHVQVLAASIRSVDHLLLALATGADIMTAPAKVLLAWAEQGLPVPPSDTCRSDTKLEPIAYQELDLASDWQSFSLTHELTDQGLTRFAQDWNAIVTKR